MNLNYLTSVIVRSLLMPVLREGINLINAMHVAKQRGIRVQETRVPAPENFTNLITIELKTGRRIASGFRNSVHRQAAADREYRRLSSRGGAARKHDFLHQ